MITLITPKNGAVVDLQTDEQQEFFRLDRSDVIPMEFDYLNPQMVNKVDRSFPEKVKFEWVCDGECTLELSENELFDNCFSYSAENSIEIENLKSNTRYFWRVSSNGEVSDTFFFNTSDMFPRFIRLDGVSNVRDCGGWKTNSGKRIKQGMIYRGPEINSHLYLTYNGMQTMKNVLRIKSVLDLRGCKELVANAYGGNYINIHAIPYCMWLYEQPDEVMQDLFKFIFNPDNYPIYFHCHGGADRTGTLAFFIGAILGMSYDDLINDYEATSLSRFGIRSRNSESYAKKFLIDFMNFEGETVQEKAEKYFIAHGIPKEAIEKFREFMLE